MWQVKLTSWYSADLKELALEVTTDPDHKFDLSLALDDLDGALAIARTLPQPESESKWKAVGDRALAVWRFDLARECFEQAGDLNSLMLLLMSTGDREGLEQLAVKSGKISFACFGWYHLIVDCHWICRGERS